MRITSEMMVANSVRRLSTRLGQYERTQSQLATGRRILKPSDHPADAGRALSLRSAQRSRQQEARNAADARNWLNLADSQLSSAVERLQRVRELAVRAANGVNASEGGAIAREVQAVQEELLSIANASHRGRPLFAGYSDGPAVGRDADGAWTYQGDDGAVMRRVGAQEQVQVNVTAAQVFGFGDPGADLFTMLGDLVAALEGGDEAAVSAMLDRVDGAMARVGGAQVTIGAHANWVESALQRSSDAQLSLRGQLAEVEDVDIAEAIMELQTQEVAYEATLAALARALPPTLATFLR